MHSTALIVSLSVNKICNKLGPNVPNNLLRNPPFYSFISFCIIWLFFINKPDSWKGLTIFMIWFICLLEIISFAHFARSKGRVPYLKIIWWIAASVTDTAAVNPNGIKVLFTDGLNTFLIKGKPFFSNGPKNLPKKSFCYLNLGNWVFDNFILAEKLFAKVLPRNFEARKLVH